MWSVQKYMNKRFQVVISAFAEKQLRKVPQFIADHVNSVLSDKLELPLRHKLAPSGELNVRQLIEVTVWSSIPDKVGG